MVHYILQTVVFQLFFLLVYDVFLKRETFFNWNRFYLLVTPLASLILPLIQIEAFKEIVPKQYVVKLPEVIIHPEQVQLKTEFLPAVFISSETTFWTWEFIVYAGISVAAVLFLLKLFKLIRAIVQSEKHRVNGYTIITMKQSTAAYSFFNYVFLGDQITANQYQTILMHECVHIKHKHSLDLLFFEMLRIVFWYNPLVYLYQNRAVALHEFIADATVIKQQDKASYYQNLLSQVFDVNHISFINPFFKQSLIKKRIIMLTKTKSKQVYAFKYVLVIPVVLGMLFYTSCDKDSDTTAGGVAVQEDRSDVLQNIEILKESIAAKGYVSDEEDAALRSLMVLVTPNGFDNPDLQDVVSDVEVPFGVVEKIPVYPGCEGVPQAEQKKCMSDNISRFIGQNFNTGLASELGIKGRQRINVLFKINSKGEIVGVTAKAEHKALEAEAIRVISMLPKMEPGQQKGKVVTVPYALPIVFQVAE
ncbi:M56 family metallopeptidase [Formosa sp. S-31]|uniref:M56 family metallopeptidase n=1 Tax=Formosa sp. S-31 TaxID=2790949 RepID=UPI003EB95684